MALPREINLDAETEQKLRLFLKEELINHNSERHSWLEEIKQQKQDYWAAPSTDSNVYPFENACSIVIPLTAIAVEAIYSRFMTSLFGLDQLVAVKAKHPAFEQIQDEFAKYFDTYLKHNVKLDTKIGDPILENVKFGTCVGRSNYEIVKKKAIQELNGVEQAFEVTIREGATIEGVPISRFLMPFIHNDAQNATWCGEEHSRSPYEFKVLEQSGFFKPGTYDSIENWIREGQTDPNILGTEVEHHQAELEKRQTVWPKTLNWVEIWLGFDVDGDEQDEEIVVHYHPESEKFLSIRYNWHKDLRRPWRKGVYFPVEYRWPGLGVAKQSEQFMREVTTQHRQRIDNATMANCRMIAVNRNSVNISPDEKIYPGKVWYLDNIADVQSIQLGDIYNSAYNNESATHAYLQQRTGVNELTLGMPQTGTPGTATDSLNRVQEGNRRYDYSYSNIKTFVDDLLLDCACNLQQFGPKNVEFYMRDPVSSELLTKVFQMPEQALRDGLILSIRSAGQKDNKLLDRQNWTQLSQFITQYFTTNMQIAQMMGNQQLMASVMQKAFDASGHAMKQILETFDIPNAEAIILPKLAELLNVGNPTSQPPQGPTGLLAGGTNP
jgi:hypothetical protein